MADGATLQVDRFAARAHSFVGPRERGDVRALVLRRDWRMLMGFVFTMIVLVIGAGRVRMPGLRWCRGASRRFVGWLLGAPRLRNE